MRNWVGAVAGGLVSGLQRVRVDASASDQVDGATGSMWEEVGMMRRLVLVAGVAVLVAGCSPRHQIDRWERRVAYCVNTDGVVMDESRCDGDDKDDAWDREEGPFFIKVGFGLPHGLEPGDKIRFEPTVVTATISHMSQSDRVACGLKARGVFGENDGWVFPRPECPDD